MYLAILKLTSELKVVTHCSSVLNGLSTIRKSILKQHATGFKDQEVEKTAVNPSDQAFREQWVASRRKDLHDLLLINEGERRGISVR